MTKHFNLPFLDVIMLKSYIALADTYLCTISSRLFVAMKSIYKKNRLSTYSEYCANLNANEKCAYPHLNV